MIKVHGIVNYVVADTKRTKIYLWAYDDQTTYEVFVYNRDLTELLSKDDVVYVEAKHKSRTGNIDRVTSLKVLDGGVLCELID
jgi:hypothetical protein